MTNEKLFPNTGKVSVDDWYRKKKKKYEFVGSWKPNSATMEKIQKLDKSIVNPKGEVKTK